ncbi:hypothetical protein [Streptomyces sp. NPDC059010]|uniref:hypothetical protein n=1 Tax=Streptomyces sp. NPDC059010 TaxID=3346695 RepID=UPI0036A529EC
MIASAEGNPLLRPHQRGLRPIVFQIAIPLITQLSWRLKTTEPWTQTGVFGVTMSRSRSLLCSRCFRLRRIAVGRIALGAEPCVEGEGDDVAVLDAVIGVVAADAPLELEDFRDGVIELSAFGVSVSDDVQGVRVRRENVISLLGLGVERVGDFT